MSGRNTRPRRGERTHPLAVSVAVVGAAKAAEVRGLGLVLHLGAQLAKRAVGALLGLAGGRRRRVEVRGLGLAEVRRVRGDALLGLVRLREVRRVLHLALRGIEVRRQAVLRVLVVLGLAVGRLMVGGERRGGDVLLVGEGGDGGGRDGGGGRSHLAVVGRLGDGRGDGMLGDGGLLRLLGDGLLVQAGCGVEG